MKRPYLIPLSWIYAGVTSLRNLLFDKNILSQQKVSPVVISVGNLRVGGTGKTPHCAFILSLLEENKVGLLSRGYGRKTTGYHFVESSSTANEVGDEPKELSLLLPHIPMAVCEDRVKGAQRLAKEKGVEVLVLDDAFQHRHINRDLNILLTEHDRPYWSDYALPAGDLRESRDGAKRADIVIVTKCPSDMEQKSADAIRERIHRDTNAQVFFTSLVMGSPILKSGVRSESKDLLLVTGIDNPTPLIDRYKPSRKITYSDHHEYTRSDMEAICSAAQTDNLDIMTTNKDFVKWNAFSADLQGVNIYCAPVEIQFLFDQSKTFATALLSAIK